MTLHQDPVDRSWWFVDRDDEYRGPYSSEAKAEERYRDYLALVVTVPSCHHA